MSHYKHLTIEEREKILVLVTKQKSLHSIAKELGRCVSTISRELKRNSTSRTSYSAVNAEKKYQKRRKKSRRHKLLENNALKETVQRLFLGMQWSPEQISLRLAKETAEHQISHRTIYRAIYAGMFDTPEQRRSTGNRGAIRNLRHRGKTRRKNGKTETRGTIVIPNHIKDRPPEAQERKEIGHWETDTMLGKLGAACLLTMADRKSRYLLADKLAKKSSQPLVDKMIPLLKELPSEYLKSITPDRGIEFAKHADVTKAFNELPFYFCDAHSPWQRGTNENINGLLREYFPKSFDFNSCSDEEISRVVLKINLRPRKCLAWKSPFEIFFGVSLHLT